MIQIKKLSLTHAAIIIFVIAFIATFIFSKIAPHIQDVDLDYVKENKGKPGFILVDVRPEENYEGRSPRPGVPGGHIPGAISFPLDDLNIAAASAALARVGITKKTTIILYCDTGVISGWFADRLVRKFNFAPSRIKNYRDGVIGWNKAGNILLPEDHDPAENNNAVSFQESEMQRP